MMLTEKKTVQVLLVWSFIVLFSTNSLASFSPESPYDSIIQVVARKYDVPSDLIHSIIKAESNYNPQAISHKGAVGLMQLMPETARQYGVKDRFDPVENIEGGVRYLKDLVKLYNRRTNLVLAAYNAGQDAVKRYGGIPPYPETVEYIERVQSSYKKPTIRQRTVIYKYYDEKGRLVLTNNRSLYLQYKNGEQ